MILKRKVNEWKMQLRIVSNPHLKPEAQHDLYNLLDSIIYKDPETSARSDEIDREGIAKLKEMMSGGNAFNVK